MMIDLSRAKDLKPDQQRRIGHRYKIIRCLARVLDDTKDEDTVARARWIMEKKEAEIEAILASAGV